MFARVRTAKNFDIYQEKASISKDQETMNKLFVRAPKNFDTYVKKAEDNSINNISLAPGVSLQHPTFVRAPKDTEKYEGSGQQSSVQLTFDEAFLKDIDEQLNTNAIKIEPGTNRSTRLYWRFYCHSVAYDRRSSATEWQ
jgi:hypothetical protein